MAPDSPRTPLLILGLDAGDPRFIEHWARRGDLPAIASVMERGAWARTGGPELVAEHGAWVAIASGVSRAEHGFYSYRQCVPGTYDLQPVLGHRISPPPFWARLGPDARVAVIDVPDAPLGRGVNGVQIQDWATHYAYGEPPRGEPTSTLREIRKRFGRRPFVPEIPISSPEEDRDLYRRMLHRVRVKGRMCRWLLEKEKFDLFFAVFADTHTGGHQLWGTHRKGPEDLKHSLRSLYQAVDREIGEIIERWGHDANVFILSSLGLKSQLPTGPLGTEFLRLVGLQPLPETAGAPARDPLGWLRRLLGPGLRRQINRVLPRRIQERLIRQKFRASADWARTRMFCIPADYAGFFRVNLRGREPHGIVEPGPEYEALLDFTQKELMKLTDPRTGKPAVATIVRTADVFEPGATDVLPDLFVEWAEADHFFDRITHPRGDLHQQPGEFHRNSDHSREGFVAACGPDIAPSGAMRPVDLLDLAPTFLHCLGCEKPAHMMGSPLDPWMRRDSEDLPLDRGAEAVSPAELLERGGKP